MGRFNQVVDHAFSHHEPFIDVDPPHHRWADVQTRARTGRPWSAYLKVSEGCDHRCTFCTIPSFRGGHASKPIERVIQEAQHLARTGCKEINLIAQDVTQYGYDLYKEFTLPRLLHQLAEVDGIEWIRILYFYPNRLTDEVIESISGLDKVCNYIDIPLQHSHPDTLRRMKRPWDGDRYLKIFDKVRARIPNVAIRTTFIVGFPGETNAEFDHLVEFVQAAKLDRVGAFEFSREPGTPSHDMPGQVKKQLKKERYDRLMRAQSPISFAKNKALVGQTMQVLVDEVKDGWIAGRSYRDAPEIDGWVYAQGTAEPGSFAQIQITEAKEHDLIGVLEGHTPTRARMVPLQMATREPR